MLIIYLNFITPPTFFSIGKSKGNTASENNLKNDIFYKNYIEYLNINECGKYFKGIGSKFVYYTIRKKEQINNKIKIICKYIAIFNMIHEHPVELFLFLEDCINISNDSHN